MTTTYVTGPAPHTHVSAPNARRLRETRATVLALAAALGKSDGLTFAECVACGARAVEGLSSRHADALQLGHVKSDAHGGAYCPCNLLPLCAACNREMAESDMLDVLTPRYDSRTGWNGVMVRDPGAHATDASERRARWLPPSV